MSTAPAEASSELIFRSWPKMIFLWPTAIICIAMGLASQFVPSYEQVWGGIFMVVLGVNLMVLTFDFPRSTSLTLATVVIATVLGLILLNQYFGIVEPLRKFFSSLDISASPDFYYVLFGVMMIMFGGMYFITRFDYWELGSNELVHHRGMLGDVERYSTAGLKLNSELSDVFEYLLWGAGRIVMTPAGSARPIVLDNVPNIHRVTTAADNILEARRVRIDVTAPRGTAPTPVNDEVGEA